MSVLFLDRCFGAHKVPSILRASCDAEVRVHDDHFPPDAKDHTILERTAKRGWLFLTKDKRIRRSPLAQQAITEAGARVYYLATMGDASAEETAAVLLKAIPRIEKHAKKHKAPYIAKIMKDGKVEPVLPPP